MVRGVASVCLGGIVRANTCRPSFSLSVRSEGSGMGLLGRADKSPACQFVRERRLRTVMKMIVLDPNVSRDNEWLESLKGAYNTQRSRRRSSLDPFEFLKWMIEKALMALVWLIRRLVHTVVKPRVQSTKSTKTRQVANKPPRT